MFSKSRTYLIFGAPGSGKGTQGRTLVRKVFYLHCPDREAVVSRLKKRAIKDNRLDDANETVIRQRLETYERESKPLLQHFDTSRIVEIDASKSPVNVLGAIISHVIKDREAEA